MVPVSRRDAPVSEVLGCVVGRAVSIRITSPVAEKVSPLCLSLYTKARNRGNGRLPVPWLHGSADAVPRGNCNGLERKRIEEEKRVKDYPLDNSRYNESYRLASQGGWP